MHFDWLLKVNARDSWPQGTESEQTWPARDGIVPESAFSYSAHIPPTISLAEPHLGSAAVEAVSHVRAKLAALSAQHTSEEIDDLNKLSLRLEAVASSKLEDIVVSHRDLAIALAFHGKASDETQEVVANVEAINEALTMTSEALDVKGLCQIHRPLLDGGLLARYGGRVRDVQNWIGGNGYSPFGAVYVPPPPIKLEELLGDLVKFCGRREITAIVRTGIAHAQFESIHPFVDGNGRAGRALIWTLLASPEEHLFLPPISVALYRDPVAYVNGLVSYREGDVNGWLTYFASQLLSAIEVMEELAFTQERAIDIWSSRAGRPRSTSVARRTIERLLVMPVINAKQLGLALEINEDVARRTLERLDESGVVSLLGQGNRNRIWICDEAVQVLEAVR